MAEAKDLYALLQVPRTASLDEIKTAYRRLARKYHPDLNPGDKEAEEKFKEISLAFEILSDEGKRKLYDEMGMDAAQIGWDPDKAAAWRRYQGARTASPGAGFDYENLGVDLGDLFGDIFGDFMGARPRARARPAGPSPGADLRASVEVDLADVVRGGTRELRLERPVTCDVCGGSGHEGAPRVCPTCGGTGRTTTTRGSIAFSGTCPTCRGTGQAPGPTCKGCGGSGVVSRPTKLEVKIPPGVADGGLVRLAGQGAAGRGGGPPGDLYLEVRVRPHPHLRREGDDLHMALPLTVHEAVAGATVPLPTFDGVLQLKIPPGTQSGRKLRLRGKGVPHLRGGGRGDLFVEARVQVPVGEASERLSAEMDKLYEGDVRAGLSI